MLSVDVVLEDVSKLFICITINSCMCKVADTNEANNAISYDIVARCVYLHSHTDTAIHLCCMVNIFLNVTLGGFLYLFYVVFGL